MDVRRLAGVLAVLLLIGMTSPADAGRHRHHCRNCTTGGASGQWYHFTSGGGQYVPFARETVAAPVQSFPQPAPYGAIRQMHYVPAQSGTYQPRHGYRPGGRGCCYR